MKEACSSSAMGLDILRQRHAQSSKAVYDALTVPLDMSGFDLRNWRSVVTTGVGSSAAHARYLAWLLRNYAALPAWYVSSGAFVHESRTDTREQALVVFSQGLSPNGRFPLSFASRFGCTILVTAAGSESGERAEALREARKSGVVVVHMPVAPEYEVLLRIVGPLVGYAVALRMATSRAGAALDFDAGAVAEAMRAASNRVKTLLPTEIRGRSPKFPNSRTTELGNLGDRPRISVLCDPITFVAAGGYGELASNLCFKVTEGMFLDPPVVVDALEFAHGPMQQMSGRRRTIIGLSRKVPFEKELFDRVKQVLEPQHTWLELRAELEEPFQIFEHEAAMNALTLAAVAQRGLDQKEWPGKGRDGSLYTVSSTADLATPPFRSSRLADLTWREVEDRIRSGDRTIVIPLGATEQHGPHLPLSVDSIIGEALAEHFCVRVPGAMHAPVISIGCSSEHMDFSGTVSFAAATLRAILMDTVSSFVRHGFTHVVLFSAHGGNDQVLSDIESDLAQEAAPARVTVVHGIERISALWREASAREGVGAHASGAHAGEFETSIIAALRPDLLRREDIRPGIAVSSEASQELFYPSLRNHAPEGVVGDPQLAEAGRGERYLSAWVDVLVAAFKQTTEAAT